MTRYRARLRAGWDEASGTRAPGAGGSLESAARSIFSSPCRCSPASPGPRAGDFAAVTQVPEFTELPQPSASIPGICPISVGPIDNTVKCCQTCGGGFSSTRGLSSASGNSSRSSFGKVRRKGRSSAGRRCGADPSLREHQELMADVERNIARSRPCMPMHMRCSRRASSATRPRRGFFSHTRQSTSISC